MIFKMKIEKGCLYSERYRVQHCFSNWHLELKNYDFILDVIANHHHYIDEITVSDNTELSMINNYTHLIGKIKVVYNHSKEKEEKNKTTINEMQENKEEAEYTIYSNKEDKTEKEHEELTNSMGKRKGKKAK